MKSLATYWLALRQQAGPQPQGNSGGDFRVAGVAKAIDPT